jgi:hypothetical protein
LLQREAASDFFFYSSASPRLARGITVSRNIPHAPHASHDKRRLNLAFVPNKVCGTMTATSGVGTRRILDAVSE